MNCVLKMSRLYTCLITMTSTVIGIGEKLAGISSTREPIPFPLLLSQNYCSLGNEDDCVQNSVVGFHEQLELVSIHIGGKDIFSSSHLQLLCT